jgi:hypothetical protein
MRRIERRGRTKVDRRRPALEALERRWLPAIDYGKVFGLGVVGTFVDIRDNAVAEDNAGNVVVVGSLQGTANFATGSGVKNLTSQGNRDAIVAEYTAAGTLIWAEAFRGQSSASVGQASAVAIDGSGNIEVAGTFSGSVNFDPGSGSTVLSAPSRNDAFAAKLGSDGHLIWAVASSGTTNADDEVYTLAPDGSGGVYIAGSYQNSVNFGAFALNATGYFEAYAAHINASGQFVWAKSTIGSGTSSAQMNGLAIDGSGRLVMAGFYAGTVNFNPAGGTALTASGGRDVAVWVLDSAGNLAWARGVGGPDFDQSDAVALDKSGNVYVTGSFSGQVNFNPSGPAANLTATGIYDVFVLKLSSSGGYLWADSFAGSNAASQGTGLGIDGSGRLIVSGWFGGTVDFDPGTGVASLTSAGSTDVFVAVLDPLGSYVAARSAGGANTDLAFGFAINASGTVATAGTYSGPATFEATVLPAIGTRSIFVATLIQTSSAPPVTSAPLLEAASDTGASSSDGITSATSPVFDVTATSPSLTVQLLRDGVVVASRTATGPLADPGRVPDGVHLYTDRQVDAAGNIGPPSPSTQVTIDTIPPVAPPAPGLLAADDSGVPGDGITNVKQPHLTGSVEPFATVQLFDGTGKMVGTASTSASGTYTIQLPAPLPDGITTYLALAIDLAGNVGPLGSPFMLTIDTIPPAAPGQLSLLPADDSGTLGDWITNVNRPHIIGTAEPFSTVVLLDAGGHPLGQATASSTGAFSIQPSTALSEGTIVLHANATDAAGNVGPDGASVSLRIITTPPAAPSLAMVAGDDTGVKGDGITLIRHPRLGGVASPGGLVQLLDSGGNVVATATASAVDGTYTLTSPAATVGFFTYRARAVDLAGNVGATGSPFTVQILAVVGDFTGDGIADVSTYNPATAVWTIRSPLDGSIQTRSFGQAGLDLPMPADYYGDGRTDIAVFRPTTDDWYILNSSTGAQTHYQFGLPGVDIPLPGDYDGIGRAEIAVYRPNTSQWFIYNPLTGVTTVKSFGYAGVDVPMPADYDGAGKLNLAVFRPTTDQWFIRNADGSTRSYQLGTPGLDRPIPADFEGTGKADIAVYRPSTGQWNILQSTGTVRTVSYGLANVDEAMPYDYDGDGKADLAVYRPPTSEFYITYSSNGVLHVIQQGQAKNDHPALVPITYRLNGLSLASGGSSAP